MSRDYKQYLEDILEAIQKIDTYGVDGVVNGVAKGAMAGGEAIRRTQTGQLQLYGLAVGIGILAIVLVMYIFG